MRPFFASLRLIRFYVLLLTLPLGWFTWGLFTNSRLLGDDNESTETLNAPGGTRGARGFVGHDLYYHK